MKPCVEDKIFNTEKEAIEYEFQVDGCYELIKHLSDNDKVIEYYNEDKEPCYKPFVRK